MLCQLYLHLPRFLKLLSITVPSQSRIQYSQPPINVISKNQPKGDNYLQPLLIDLNLDATIAPLMPTHWASLS